MSSDELSEKFRVTIRALYYLKKNRGKAKASGV
jgi:hypothetical protein